LKGEIIPLSHGVFGRKFADGSEQGIAILRDRPIQIPGTLQSAHMQTLRAKSSRDWNVWFAMIFAKGVGFGQIADRARWRIRLPLSLGSRLGHLDGFGSDSFYAFMRV
jgi:hypothetical protein